MSFVMGTDSCRVGTCNIGIYSLEVTRSHQMAVCYVFRCGLFSTRET